VPYAVIEKSGSGIVKDVVKLRVDYFLNPDDPNYERHYVNVPVIPPEGYPGKVDKEGNPKDQKDYDAWLESLPHVWQNNPFHSHKIWLPKEPTDNYIKAQIERTLNYFYTFHQQSWNTGVPFIENWKKVPKVKGSIRDIFVKGDPKDKVFNQQKVADVLSRKDEFQIGVSRVPPTDLNIGEKGTIDIGAEPVGGGSTLAIYEKTYMTLTNPANASGTIDTIDVDISAEATDLYVGLLYLVSGTTYKVRSSEQLGNVAANPEPFTGLTIAVETNDCLALFDKNSSNSRCHYASSGYGGLRRCAGECIDEDDQADFSDYYDADATILIYGTGTESGGVNYEESATVYIGVVPFASRALAYDRDSSVIIGVLVAASKSWGRSISSSVIIGVLVAASVIMGYVKNASVIIGNLVSASRALASTRSSAVIVGVLVAASVIMGYVKKASVIIGNLVSASRALASTRSSAVIVGVLVAASVIMGYVKSASVIVGNLVAASRTFGATRSSSVIVGVLATASRALTYTRTASVIIGNLVSASGIRGFTRSASVLVGNLVSASRTLSFTRSASTIIGVKVSASRTTGFTRSASVIIGNLVSASGAWGTVRSASVIIGELVSASRVLSFTRSASVSIGNLVSASSTLAIAAKTALVIIGVKVTASYCAILKTLLRVPISRLGISRLAIGRLNPWHKRRDCY